MCRLHARRAERTNGQRRRHSRWRYDGAGREWDGTRCKPPDLIGPTLGTGWSVALQRSTSGNSDSRLPEDQRETAASGAGAIPARSQFRGRSSARAGTPSGPQTRYDTSVTSPCPQTRISTCQRARPVRAHNHLLRRAQQGCRSSRQQNGRCGNCQMSVRSNWSRTRVRDPS